MADDRRKVNNRRGVVGTSVVRQGVIARLNGAKALAGLQQP